MPILPDNESEYVEEDEDVISADAIDGAEITDNKASYSNPFDYNGPSDIGVPESGEVTPVEPEEDETYYEVTYRGRVQLDSCDPPYLEELYQNGAKFYAIYDDDTEVEVQWYEIEDLDPMETEIDLADSIASASNQHFWDDDNGAHVAEVSKEDWETAVEANFSDLSASKNYYNILMNSLGILLRRATFNLTSITRSGISFYDGLGNNVDNIMASFGRSGAQIGKSSQKHVIINTDGIGSYNGDGTVADFTMRGASIVDGTVKGSSLVDNTITGGKIADTTITGSKLVDSTITGAKIANATITGSNIDSGTITNANIQDGTITGAKIQGSTLTNIPFASIVNAAIEVATIAQTEIGKATIRQAQVENLSADYAHLTQGVIDNAKIDKADVNGLAATYATIANLTAANAKISDLEATRVTTEDLEANYIDANTIEANYTKTDFSNTDVAWIQNGVIKDGAISSAMINDVSANKLTAGTINGSVINVTNLNADNITTGTINGQRIGEGSLSLSKLEDDVYTEAEVDAKLSTMQSQIDGAIETWTGTAVPTLQNFPASSWNTTALKDSHVGDVYFVVNSQSQQNGYNYRFTKSGSTYSWQLIKDSDVTNALQRLNTAEGKIGDIEQFDSDISSWKVDTDEEISSIKSSATTLAGRVSTAEGQIATKVDTTTFNTLSQTVDENSASITQLTTETTSISNRVDSQNPFIVGTQTAQTGNWTGDAPTLTSLVDGQQITYWLPYPPSGNASLDLTLKDGSTTGAIPCYYGGTSRLTTHYPANNAIHLTYRMNVSGVAQGWWADANYDANSPYTKYSDSVIAGKNGLKRYTICMRDDGGNFTSIVNQANNTNVSGKTCYTGGLQLGSVCYHSTGGDYAAGANSGNVWESYGGVDFRYSVNGVANAASTELQLRKPVYLVGTIGADGLLYLDTTKWWTQTSFVEGKAYILVGTAYSTYYAIFVSVDNPTYIYEDGELVEIQTSRITKATNKVNTVSDTVDEHTRKIGNLETTVESKADGSTVSTISNKLNMVSDTVDGHTQSISSITSTQTTMQGKLDKTLVETTQLWFSKANTTAPNKPTAQVTSTSTEGNAWRVVVPAYNASYPNYYYCYQWKYSDGTYGWSSVTRDIAMGESQERARTAITNAAAADTKAGNAASAAATAVSTANTANDNASTALSTANTAASDASDAKADAATAVSTANTASSNASTALSTANTASSNASTAVSTANTAKSTANTAKATADKNVKSTTQLWYTKANETAPAKPTTKVTSTAVSGNGWRVVVPTYASDYPYYFYCYQYELANGTFTWSDVVYDRATTENQSNSRNAVTGVSTLTTKTNNIQDTVDGHTQSLQSITQTQTSIQQNAVKSTVQLWFTKANTTAPSKPTAHVTTNNAATGNAWNLAVPTYNASYPHYYYCYEYQYVDGSYGWSAVTRDIATGEMQERARTAITNAANAQADIDGLEIGGRNLLLWSGDANHSPVSRWGSQNNVTSKSYDATYDAFKYVTPADSGNPNNGMSISTQNVGWWVNEYGSSQIANEKTYTFSIDVMGTLSSGNPMTMKVFYSTSAGDWVGAPNPAVDITDKVKSDSFTRVSATFTLPSIRIEGTRIVLSLGAKGATFYVKNPKLELGNRATDWSPAPEDVDADISTAQTSANNAQATANKNVKESQQLWFTKANGSAPAKPTAKVTSTSTGGNAWTTKVPTYNENYKYYFYCMQYIAADGTVTWSDVVYDQATTEAQNVSRTTSANLTTLQQDYATFKQTTTQFESTIGTTYATKTELQTTDDKIENLEIGGRNLLKGTGDYSSWDPSNQSYATYLTATDDYIKFTSPSSKYWLTIEPHNGFISIEDWDVISEYTVSVDIKWDNKKTTPAYPRIAIETCSNKNVGYSTRSKEYYAEILPSNDNWTHFEYTFSGDYNTWHSVGSADSVYIKALIWLYIDSSEADGVYIRNLKLEKGNRATDWTPAPEDVDAAIEASPKYKYVTSAYKTAAPQSYAKWLQWGQEGTTLSSFALASTSEKDKLNVGDLACCEGTNATDNKPIYIVIEVTSFSGATSINGISHGLIDSEIRSTVNAIESRVTNAETSITQTNNQIALKANASDVYTKTDVNGLISTEVTNRNSAIQQSANAINLSVSQTYTTKTEFNALEVGGNRYYAPWDRDISVKEFGYLGADQWKSTGQKQDFSKNFVMRVEFKRSSQYQSQRYCLASPYGVVNPGTGSSNPEVGIELAGSHNQVRIYSTDDSGGATDKYTGFIPTVDIWTTVILYWNASASKFSWFITDGDRTNTGNYTVSAGSYQGVSGEVWIGSDSRHNSTWNCAYEQRDMPAVWYADMPEDSDYICYWNDEEKVSGEQTGVTEVIRVPGSTMTSAMESAISEIRTTAEGITSTVEKISSAKYLTSVYSGWSLANIKIYGSYDMETSFTVTSTEGVRVGDTVYIKGTDTTRNCTVYIKGVVKTVNSTTSVTIYGRGYEDILPVESIKSTINQSSDSVKIEARHVNIEGAAIFSSGRLSTTSLNNAYDAKGAASTAESNAKTYADTQTADIYEKIRSQGIQLVTNGNGFMGDNTNWPGLTFDGSKANGSPGAFTKAVGYSVLSSSEMFPVDPSKEYLFEFDAMSDGGTGRLYSFLTSFDVDKKEIFAQNVFYYPNTLTTLAKDLNPGDTTITLSSAANFASTTQAYQRSLVFWDYSNAYGYTYPAETYSRNYYTDLYADDSKVNKSTGVITLKKAWSGPKKVSGTYVSQSTSGSTYNYAHVNVVIPSAWTHYSLVYSGLDIIKDGTDNVGKFRQGTAFAKIGFLWNYSHSSTNPQGQIWVTNISVKEATATKSELGSVATIANAAAPKTAAVSEEQYIYFQAESGEDISSTVPSSVWVTKTDECVTVADDEGTSVNTRAWSTKTPTYNSTYPVTWMAKQRKTVSGTVTTTTPTRHAVTTVIDGAQITTGTIDAERLNVDDIASSSVMVAAINGAVSEGTENLISSKDAGDMIKNSIEESETKTNKIINNLNEDVSDLSSNVTSLMDWTEIGPASLKMGKATSYVTMELTNESLEFLASGEALMRLGVTKDENENVTGSYMVIDKAVILQQLQFGNYAFRDRGSDHMSLQWIGD